MKKIEIGQKVLVQFDGSDPEVFEIVEPGSADVLKRKISADSRFGQAVIGACEGKVISYQNYSDKKIQCKVIRIN